MVDLLLALKLLQHKPDPKLASSVLGQLIKFEPNQLPYAPFLPTKDIKPRVFRAPAQKNSLFIDYYPLKSGETIDHVAKSRRLSLQDIQRWNPDTDLSKLTTGSPVKLPKYLQSI